MNLCPKAVEAKLQDIPVYLLEKDRALAMVYYEENNCYVLSAFGSKEDAKSFLATNTFMADCKIVEANYLVMMILKAQHESELKKHIDVQVMASPGTKLYSFTITGLFLGLEQALEGIKIV